MLENFKEEYVLYVWNDFGDGGYLIYSSLCSSCQGLICINSTMTCCLRGVPWLHVAPRGLEDAWGQEDEISPCSPAYFQVLVSGTADCYGHFVICKYLEVSFPTHPNTW